MVLKYAVLIDEKTGECLVSDLQFPHMTSHDVTKSLVDGKWYLTEKLENDRTYQIKVFNITREAKFKEISEKYDIACKYGICEVVVGENTYYANRCWLSTWQEAIAGLEFTKSTAFVRLYEKQGGVYRNITLENITVDMYKKLYLDLIDYRFNTLQARRNKMLEDLVSATTVDEIVAIEVNLGDILNEQEVDYMNL